jgi:hypothetical protein
MPDLTRTNLKHPHSRKILPLQDTVTRIVYVIPNASLLIRVVEGRVDLIRPFPPTRIILDWHGTPTLPIAEQRYG